MSKKMAILMTLFAGLVFSCVETADGDFALDGEKSAAVPESNERQQPAEAEVGDDQDRIPDREEFEVDNGPISLEVDNLDAPEAVSLAVDGTRNHTSPWWQENGTTDEIFYNGGYVGIGAGDPRAKLHAKMYQTNSHYDTLATAIIEGREGRLQLAANDSGATGATLILSNRDSQRTRNWLMGHKTNNHLYFYYGSMESDGSSYTTDTKRYLSIDSGDLNTATLTLSRNIFHQAGWYAAIRVVDSFDPQFQNHRSAALFTGDVNHMIWSPYLVEGNEYGIYWAANQYEQWDSGQYPSNPNEVVFVGGGQKQAAISLRNGNAYFNRVKARELVLDVNRWADYVFEDDYALDSLEEVESYIAENGHLPDMPSAAEVEEHGVSIGEAQTKLLQKVEELTLHLIDQNKTIKEQRGEIEHLKQVVSEITNGGR